MRMMSVLWLPNFFAHICGRMCALKQLCHKCAHLHHSLSAVVRHSVIAMHAQLCHNLSAIDHMGMDRQISLAREQMLRTERSIRSVGKGRMIVLFNSSTLQIDCHFLEEFFNFERRIKNDQCQRSTSVEKRETETYSVN